MRRILALVGLVLAAFAASALPYVHEALRASATGMATAGTAAMPGMAPMAATGADIVPAATAQLAIAAKMALAALGAAAFVLWLVRRERPAADSAGLSMATAAALASTAVAIGLAAFDCCTQFHGGGIDASGACHCWLTGVLAAAGSLVAALAILCGGAIRAWASTLIAVIVALVVRLAPRGVAAASRARRSLLPARRPTPLVARRIAGRAPPLHA